MSHVKDYAEKMRLGEKALSNLEKIAQDLLEGKHLKSIELQASSNLITRSAVPFFNDACYVGTELPADIVCPSGSFVFERLTVDPMYNIDNPTATPVVIYWPTFYTCFKEAIRFKGILPKYQDVPILLCMTHLEDVIIDLDILRKLLADTLEDKK